jgi:membrane protease YdiL (CAAX protease family)
MKTQMRRLVSIVAVATLVVMADTVAMPIVSKYLYGSASATIVFVSDFGIVLFAGIAGLFLAPRLGCPFWWRAGNGSPASRRMTLLTALLGLVVVASNALALLVYRDQVAHANVAPWMALLTPARAVALAFRAALNEEIFFRLFLFPGTAWVVGHFIPTRQASLLTGVLVSAIVYGVMHPGFLMAFLVGCAFSYIYYRLGLLPAMVVHFFTDAIPFTLLSLL